MTETEYLKALGKRIKAIRLKKKMSLIHIQEKGVTNISNMSRTECGKVNPHLLTLKKLAEVLEVEVTDFL